MFSSLTAHEQHLENMLPTHTTHVNTQNDNVTHGVNVVESVYHQFMWVYAPLCTCTTVRLSSLMNLVIVSDQQHLFSDSSKSNFIGVKMLHSVNVLLWGECTLQVRLNQTKQQRRFTGLTLMNSWVTKRGSSRPLQPPLKHVHVCVCVCFQPVSKYVSKICLYFACLHVLSPLGRRSSRKRVSEYCSACVFCGHCW